MGARHKLNVGYFNGSIIIAAVIGLLFQSWNVFAVTALIGVGFAIYLENIRP